MLDNTFYMKLDQMYDQGQYDRAEAYLLEELEKASEDEKNHGDRATVLNELMGFYRVKADFENCDHYLKALLREIRSLHLKDGEIFATFTLNIANAYRAMGRLDEAERNFLRVRDIYEEELAPDDYRLASLYNNISLVYLAKNQKETALDYMRKALAIVEVLPGAEMYAAVTNVNMAAPLMEMGAFREAKDRANAAKMIFESMEQKPAEDYAAVLNLLGKIAMQEEDYEKAVVSFGQAAEVYKAAFGETKTYEVIVSHLNEADQKRKNA